MHQEQLDLLHAQMKHQIIKQIREVAGDLEDHEKGRLAGEEWMFLDDIRELESQPMFEMIKQTSECTNEMKTIDDFKLKYQQS